MDFESWEYVGIFRRNVLELRSFVLFKIDDWVRFVLVQNFKLGTGKSSPEGSSEVFAIEVIMFHAATICVIWQNHTSIFDPGKVVRTAP
jgi:hypothetical protein